MGATLKRQTQASGRPAGRILAALATTLMLGACAQIGDAAKPDLLASADQTDANPPTYTNQTELERATDYWGKQYGKSPRDLDAALAYAKNLKALGQKSQALSVLQQASMFHPSSRKLTSEYGRLALELDQVGAAQQLLEAADDPANPDWRVISARGTVLAKQGKYAESIPFYEKALTLARDQPSILNNLALAHMMSGNPQAAEPLLRQASAQSGATGKVRQNLALVLGVQGKYDEAKHVASADVTPETAAYNTDLVRRIVKLDPQKSPGAKPATQVARAGSPKLKAGTPDAATTTGWQSQVADVPEQGNGGSLRATAD